MVAFRDLRQNGHLVLSLQPALTTGTAPAEYLLNSLDPTFSGGDQLGVWAFTNRGGVANGVRPTLSSVMIPSESYSVPPNAEQSGSELADQHRR